MVQILPAMILGLYTRWFSGWALLIGWAAGMIVGTSLSWTGKAWVPVHALNWDIPFVGDVDLGLGFAAYNGLTAVLVNLLLNALDAMPRGGTLTLRLEADVANGIHLSVSDTGSGIPPEMKGRLFVPFNSSKATATP